MTLEPFPIRTYINFSRFRTYYAFGSSPPEDLLSCLNGLDSPTPHVLSLGCGDMRNCFYTIFKHFELSLGNSAAFTGVHFIMNDIIPGILARNLVQLLLAVEMPDDVAEATIYLRKAWSIFYNHCMTEEELELLKSCLKKLLSWTESEENWKETRENPLRNSVSFYSEATVKELRKMWTLWLAGYPGSKEEMLKCRKEYLMGKMRASSLSELKYKVRCFSEAKCLELVGKLSVHKLANLVVDAANQEIVD